MSIDYTALFTRVGSVVKAVNSLTTAQVTYGPLGTVGAAVFDAYENREDVVDGLVSAWSNTAAGLAGQVGTLKAVVDRTLADLQSALNSPTTNTPDILTRLYEDMVLNAQTVNASVVAAPSVAAVAGNTGTGTLVASKVDALGRDAEVSLTETVRFVCTADQYGSGSPPGGEVFSVTGWPAIDANAAGTRGNGNGQSLAVLNEGGGNIAANGDFDAFTVANTPDGWTLATPAQVGVNVFSEATLVHAAGGTALKLAGNSSATTVTLSQNIAGVVRPLTRYAAGAFVRKGAGTFASGSTLAIRVTGTGFSTVNLFTGDPSSALTTSYALKSTWFNVGEVVPADLAVEITWTTAGGVAATGAIYVDDLAVGEAYVFGGISYAIFRGATDFTERDAFTSGTSVTTPGVFQSFFSRFYQWQAPSSGSPSIADSLAV